MDDLTIDRRVKKVKLLPSIVTELAKQALEQNAKKVLLTPTALVLFELRKTEPAPLVA